MAGGLYVETTADLGAVRNEVQTLQHHHSDLHFISVSFSAFCSDAADRSVRSEICG
jgi:hypothetical protein